MSAIAADIPRKRNLGWLIPMGVLLMLMGLLMVGRSPTFEDDSGGGSGEDPGDGNLANGESLCDEAGADCIGAFSFQASGYAQTGDVSNWEWAENPALQTSKKLQVSSNASYSGRSVWYKQPGSTHSIQTNCLGTFSCMRLSGTGQWSVEFTPSQISSTESDGRAFAVRYLVRINSGYQTTGDGSCSNDKYIQMADYWTSGSSTNFTSSNGGSMGFGPSSVLGDWLSIEMAVDDYGSPTQARYSLTNLTDGTATVSFTRPAGSNLLDAGTRDGFSHPMHRYRAGSCSGTSDQLFVMAKFFNSFASAYIGPPYEVESLF